MDLLGSPFPRRSRVWLLSWSLRLSVAGIRFGLNQLGYTNVILRESVMDALHVLARMGPHIGVVIVDLDMPIVNGP